MEVIREFVLRGRMEIVKADLQVPDISSFTKATEESNRLNAELAQRVEAVSRAMEEGAQLAKQREESEKSRREEESKARKEEKDAAEERKRIKKEEAEAAKSAAEEDKKRKEFAAKIAALEAEAARKAAEEIASFEKAKLDAMESSRRAAEEQSKRQRELNDLYLKGGDALKQTADGAFALARGITLVSLEGTEDLEKVVRKVADLQGKFDILRGSVDFIKGTAESTRAFGGALEKAGGASAVLASGLASATRAAAPLIAAVGPAGAIALGLGAIAVASAAAWKAFSDGAQEAADKAIKAMQEASAESGRIARENELGKLGSRLGAAVTTAEDRLSIARATGSEQDQEAARRALDETRIRAAEARERQLREQSADPRLSAPEGVRLGADIQDARADVAAAQRAQLLGDAEVQGAAQRKRRDEAEQLVKEQQALQREREGLSSDLDVSLFGTDRYSAASDRVAEIDRRVSEIQAKNPAATLADAIGKLVELQEETNRQVESLNNSIAIAKANAERSRAEADRLQAQLQEGQP